MSSAKVKALIILILAFITSNYKISCKFVPVPEKFECCNIDGKLNRIDPTKVEMIAIDDGISVLNGTLKVLKIIKSPWHLKMTSRKWERGKWVPAIVNKEVYDICSTLKSPLEGWYHVTKNMKLSGCPIKSGVCKDLLKLIPTYRII